MIVTLRHVLTIPGYSARGGYCRKGTRLWVHAHGFDWRDFVRNGIDADALLATGDALALAAVEWARKCEESR